jgi:hypothetical protein
MKVISVVLSMTSKRCNGQLKVELKQSKNEMYSKVPPGWNDQDFLVPPASESVYSESLRDTYNGHEKKHCQGGI